MKKIDVARFEQYLADGWLVAQTHPVHTNLKIYNYSRKTQYEFWWDEITLLARQLIVDTETGRIVAKSFTKFHNYSTVKDELPDLPYTVYEKRDGSIISTFQYKGEWLVASKGSFESPQAIRAREIFRDRYKNRHEQLDGSYTYLFELIDPSNRIINDYGSETDLYLLGVIHTDTHEELDISTEFGFSLPKTYDFKSIDELVNAEQIENFEGYVVKYSNNFRFKFKFDKYCQLAKAVTYISEKSVWSVAAGYADFSDVLELLPDEYDAWFRNLKVEFEHKHAMLTVEVLKIYDKIVKSMDEKGNLDFTDKTVNKTFAAKVMEYRNVIPYYSLLFSVRDRNFSVISETIWKHLEPVGRVMPQFHDAEKFDDAE